MTLEDHLRFKRRSAVSSADLFEANEYCYHAVATNREERATEVVWLPNKPGDSANCHKESKLGFGLEQLRSRQFPANALLLAIRVLAYNLRVVLKAEVLADDYRHSAVQTMRWQLYRLSGKLVRHRRQWFLKLRTDGEKLALLAVRKRCFELS